MNTEEFVNGIASDRNFSIEAVIKSLKKPSGRAPRKKDVVLSQFYHSLTDEQKVHLSNVVKESVDMALFSFLCILDHVGFIEDVGEKTQFELYAVKDGKRTLINDPDKEELHNLFNDLTLEN